MLIGMIGEVVEHYPSYTLIRVHGEIWNAHSHSPLQVGQRIKVKKITDLRLLVEPVSNMEK